MPPACGVSTGAGVSAAGDGSGFGASARRAERRAESGVTAGASAFGGSVAIGWAGDASLTNVFAASRDSGRERVRLNTTTAAASSRRRAAMITKVRRFTGASSSF